MYLSVCVCVCVYVCMFIATFECNSPTADYLSACIKSNCFDWGKHFDQMRFQDW
jgi:hypothetical protein